MSKSLIRNKLIIITKVRMLHFTLALLLKLAKDSSQRMEQAVEESYNTTLKLWHGWISSATFKVIIPLTP
ncbi:glycolipid transfer protein 3-like [Carya illinoinensis]|uniref:glycolipid transfer protein 3-like n=1 Tax=Carya illinoinensis TaxID=32201 RepID=UPI001C724F3E|nr:glycolipid transfer protein 3-like [Carya illinoinensis]